MKNVVFHAEEVIFSQGDPSTDTFRILKGSVDILVTGKDGADKKIASLGAEEVFGEMGIIDPAPRSATAIAREDTACLVYSPDEVLDLMSSDPAEAVALIRSLIIRLRNANRKVMATAPSA